MTREEAINVLKHNYPSSCYENLCKAVDMAIEALEQPEQRWIPCSERLPEKNVWVLVTFMMANGGVDTDIMRINRWDGGWDTHTFDMAYRETVIAWMPLPEGYKGE